MWRGRSATASGGATPPLQAALRRQPRQRTTRPPIGPAGPVGGGGGGGAQRRARDRHRHRHLPHEHLPRAARTRPRPAAGRVAGARDRDGAGGDDGQRRARAARPVRAGAAVALDAAARHRRRAPPAAVCDAQRRGQLPAGRHELRQPARDRVGDRDAGPHVERLDPFDRAAREPPDADQRHVRERQDDAHGPAAGPGGRAGRGRLGSSTAPATSTSSSP